MEVVLPNGELMRTGMGALPGSRAWQDYKHGFGPDPRACSRRATSASSSRWAFG